MGCNIGVIANPHYEGVWWGEGEAKIRFDSETFPTLCGTGAEDYIGTAWRQGVYAHRLQGCLLADAPSGKYSFYRLHIDDPVYFDEGIQVSIQTIGGCDKNQALSLLERGIPLIPVTLDAGIATPLVKFMQCDSLSDLRTESLPHGWCNFWRQDDWLATAYFYLDSPNGISASLDLTLNAWRPIPNAIIVVVFLNPVRGRYTFS